LKYARSPTLELLAAANPADAERWSTLVFNSPTPDVYYLPEYARATAEIEHSEPVAVVAGADSCRFLAPFLVRRMSAIAEDSMLEWTDAASPYGYGGLLLPARCGPANADDFRCFLDDLQNWCDGRNIVCCVLRLHPLMQQAEWFASEDWEKRCLRTVVRGSTTAINIANWDDVRDRPFGMHKGRHSDLNLARRTLRVTWASGEDRNVESHLDCFAAMYEQTIEAHGADSFYRFPAAYFSRVALLGQRLGIAFAWQDDRLAGASIFLAGRDWAHYHLACGSEIGMRFKAATLLVVEGARWARARGCKLLHLGGGLQPGDSLESFKRSFGGQLYRYAYLVSIANEERFEQLCRIPNAPWPYRMTGT
jgi:Acetyltransferase (GNAT) domain